MNRLPKTRKKGHTPKTSPPSGLPRKGRPRVRSRQATSPTGKTVVVSWDDRQLEPSEFLPPCLRGHRVTRLVP